MTNQRKREIKNLKERVRYYRKKYGQLIDINRLQIEELSTEEIHSLRGSTLLEHIQPMYIDPETGEVSFEFPEIEDDFNTRIIDEITRIINGFNYEETARRYNASYAKHKQNVVNFLKGAWENVVSENGAYEVASRIESLAGQLSALTNHLVYDSESITNESFNIQEWASLIIGGAVSSVEAMFLQDLAESSGLAYLSF